MQNPNIVIPAYQPNEKLISIIIQLKENGFSNIIIVDDGSDAFCEDIFIKAKELDCFLVRHSKNKGKGAALKTGIKYISDNFDVKYGIITADADGQHKVSDIVKVAKVLKTGTNELVLGMRNFSIKTVPFKSYFGNKVTSLEFQASTSVECKDTQTGLRGIPKALIKTALQTEGVRYEYEYNFLKEAVRQTNIHCVEIDTVYFGKNEQSHFRVIHDSILIYQRPIKFIISSFIGFLTDIVLFSIIAMALSVSSFENIAIATVSARIISGFVNYLINKKSVFYLKGNTASSIIKYFLLFVFIMGASTIGTTGLTLLLNNSVLSKIIIDIMLFFFSYSVQKNWVFVQKMDKRTLSKLWKATATMFFIGYFSFTLLNRFVISQNVVVLDEEDNTITNEEIAKEDVTEAIITATSYSDEDIQVEISTIRQYDTNIYIADIVLSDPSQLKTGLAENSFGTNVKEKTSVIAQDNDAIIAINGDYYGFRDYGYVMRNGYLYRQTQTIGGNEDLVIFEDGTMQIINENDITANELSALGATQIFSFGPGLILNSEIIVNEESKVEREDESNPRTAIAMIDENHYIFMVADGRTDISEGLSLYEMAMVLSEYDCEIAYNLDGGGSATMVFMGEVINNPTTNGRDFKERSVSDIVYIGK